MLVSRLFERVIFFINVDENRTTADASNERVKLQTSTLSDRLFALKVCDMFPCTVDGVTR